MLLFITGAVFVLAAGTFSGTFFAAAAPAEGSVKRKTDNGGDDYQSDDCGKVHRSEGLSSKAVPGT